MIREKNGEECGGCCSLRVREVCGVGLLKRIRNYPDHDCSPLLLPRLAKKQHSNFCLIYLHTSLGK